MIAQLSGLLGAINFDPEIRGIFVVLVGVVVLMGSIYLILVTNTGVRAGFLILMSGLFGWMFLMGAIWVIYGIGFIGRVPAWMPTDINYTREAPVPGVPELAELPAEEALPVAEDILDRYPLLHALALGAEGADYEPATLTKLKTVTQPWIIVSQKDLRPIAESALTEGKEVLDEHPELVPVLEQRGVALRDRVREEARDLRAEIEEPIGDWCLLTESDPRRGEAVASSDAALIADKAFGDPTETSDYIVEDVFLYGGKEPCEPIEEQSMAWRTWHRIYTTLQVKNPKLLAAVTLVKAQEVTVEPGQAPPPAAKEEGASTVTVAMLRNLGNRRFIPFLFTVFSLLGFVVFTTMLHYRDKRAMELRAAFTGAKGR